MELYLEFSIDVCVMCHEPPLPRGRHLFWLAWPEGGTIKTLTHKTYMYIDMFGRKREILVQAKLTPGKDDKQNFGEQLMVLSYISCGYILHLYFRTHAQCISSSTMHSIDMLFFFAITIIFFDVTHQIIIILIILTHLPKENTPLPNFPQFIMAVSRLADIISFLESKKI